jgi:hypothetical protein
MFLIVDEHGQTLGRFKSHTEVVAAWNALVEKDRSALDECAVVRVEGEKVFFETPQSPVASAVPR